MSTPEYTEKDETMQALERMWPAVEKIKELKEENKELKERVYDLEGAWNQADTDRIDLKAELRKAKQEIIKLYEDKEYLVTLLSQANQKQREAA